MACRPQEYATSARSAGLPVSTTKTALRRSLWRTFGSPSTEQTWFVKPLEIGAVRAKPLNLPPSPV